MHWWLVNSILYQLTQFQLCLIWCSKHNIWIIIDLYSCVFENNKVKFGKYFAGDYFTGYTFLELKTKGKLYIRKWIGINTLNYMTQNMWNKFQPDNYDGHEGGSACAIAAWDDFPSTGLDDIKCSYKAHSLICEYVIRENN